LPLARGSVTIVTPAQFGIIDGRVLIASTMAAAPSLNDAWVQPSCHGASRFRGSLSETINGSSGSQPSSACSTETSSFRRTFLSLAFHRLRRCRFRSWCRALTCRYLGGESEQSLPPLSDRGFRLSCMRRVRCRGAAALFVLLSIANPTLSAETLEKACERYSLLPTKKAASARKLEPGKLYVHYGYVLQFLNEALVVDMIGIEHGEPWALLIFDDPSKVGNPSFELQKWVQAIVRFEKFQNVPMADGSERRLATFTCLGFSPYGQSFTDTAKPDSVVPNVPSAGSPSPTVSDRSDRKPPPANVRQEPLESPRASASPSPVISPDRQQWSSPAPAAAKAESPKAVSGLRSAYVRPVACDFSGCDGRGLHGNVYFSFADGSEKKVIDTADCVGALLTQDRVTAGWTLGRHTETPQGIHFINDTLVLFRGGRVIAQLKADRPLIERWELRPERGEAVIVSRARHGPSSVQLFDIASGALKQKFLGYEISSRSPDWARPFAEKTTAATIPVAEQDSPHTPSPGSQEREDILDALRQRFYGGDRAAAHRNAKKVLFTVALLRVKADWAFTCATPVKSSGENIGKSRCSLLHRVGGRWVDQNCFEALRIYDLDRAGENVDDRGGTMMQKIQRIFPNAPRDIFPENTEQQR
jgi:hypothetical protein